MAKTKLTSVKNAHHVHTEDIDKNAVKAGGDQWEALINICVKAAEEALDTPPNGYSVWQRNSISDTFVSMRATHRAIRALLKLGDTHPESVDALVLARLQLEGLYNLCLMLESPDWVTRFQENAHRHQCCGSGSWNLTESRPRSHYLPRGRLRPPSRGQAPPLAPTHD